jgi:PAS domain S-box-containing protein
MLTDTPVLGRTFLAKSGFHSMATWLVALAITSVFALDCLTPLGIAIPFFYILILWVTLAWAPSQVFTVTAASSALTVIGMFLSPEGALWTGLTNRTITLVALWFLAYSGMAYRKTVDLLCKRERELTDFVENAPVGIHWIAPDGTILWANQNEIDMLGYDKEEYVGRHIAEFHVDREVAEDILGKLDTNVPLKDCAARLRHKDGSIRHVLISCHACREDGRFTHSRCFMQDITDRIRAELAKREREQRAAANARLVEATAGRQTERLEQRVRERTAQLRESEERLNFSLRMSHTGGWDLDLVDHTAHRTLEHDRIFGYGALLPQWTYEQFLEHVLREDRAEVDRRFREATATQTDWNFECRIRRVDGEVRWIWAAGEHQRDAAGRMRRMAGIVQDITERKLAEEALRENKRRLRLAFEDRERLSRDLHDNIIQVIYAIGMQLEACQRLPRDDPKDVAKQLARAIRGLNDVIRDVRGYISGPVPQILRRPDLRTELARLVETIGATGTLRFRLNVDPWAVAWLTPPQAEHILHIAREALSNAMKHSQARRGVLSLHGADNSACLEVSDDGIGFEPKAQDGKGAGLRNMKSRAQQIGAKLDVLSSSGQGTRIILTFPEAKEIHAAK